MSWADMMVAESPDVPLLLEDLPTQVQGEPIGENSEGDTSSDLFDMGDMEEDGLLHFPCRTAQTPPVQPTQSLRLTVTCMRCANGLRQN